MGKQIKKSDDQPMISVIIPVYNTQDYLSRCLGSILENTYHNLEIICINDGSTDGSAELLNNFAQSDARIRVIHKENEGVSVARNIGLSLAAGEYVAFVDSDDWVHQRYFEILIHFILKFNADVAVCREVNVSSTIEDTPVHINSIQSHCLSLIQSVSDYSAKRRIWGRIYSKKIIYGHSFCQEIKLGEDAVFNLDVICSTSNLRLVMVESSLYYYFSRSNSAVHTADAIKLRPSIQWYLSHIRDACTDEVKKIYLFEAFKGALSYRYGIMFEPEWKKLQIDSRRMISDCVQEMKQLQNIPVSRRFQYTILAAFPFIYRTFRIIDDKTMLDWEKEQKRKLKEYSSHTAVR